MQAVKPLSDEKKLNAFNASLNPPSGDREAFLLHLADTNLILAQRNAEWCGHGPILEQDIAITNISLDLLGQARNFYQYAAEIINEKSASLPGFNVPASLEGDFPDPGGTGAEVTEDSLAYLRTEREFRNFLITELPNNDWAQTILRQFFFSVYQFLLYDALQKSNDGQLAAIAEKSLKEVTYHVKWSSEWVIRLGDGTEESRQRMLKAIENLWMYTGELFITEEYEKWALGEPFLASLKEAWHSKVRGIFEEATLPSPENTYMQTGGKRGYHTEYLGIILAEMQYLQRTYPGSRW